MQVILLISFLVGDVTASVVLFRLAPLNPICIWYPSLLVYGVGHLINAFLTLLVIGLIWWLLGNPAAWESICRTRQRGKTLCYGGIAGAALDIFTSLLMRFAEPHADMQRYGASGSIVPWLLLRAVVWAAAYAATGSIFLLIFHLQLRSRRIQAIHAAKNSQ